MNEEFEYHRPATIEDAIKLLKKMGKVAKVIAGGTDLIVHMQNKTIKPERIVSIKGIPNLDYISFNASGVKIGALTTIRAIEKSAELQKRCGILSQAAHSMASISVRNLATIGGNLCNASPAADMAPPLIGLSATVKIVGPEGERMVLLEDFFTGPSTTVLEDNELLVEIQVPPLPPYTGGSFLKVGRRGGAADVAIVGVAAVVTLESTDGVCREAKVVLGSAAPTPKRSLKAEQILKGKQINDTVIEEAAQAASEEASPISDVHSSAQYRKKMVKVFSRRAIKAAVESAKGR